MAKKSTGVKVEVHGQDKTEPAWKSVANRAAKTAKAIAVGAAAATAAVGAAAVATINQLGNLSDIAVQSGMSFEGFQKLLASYDQLGIHIGMNEAAASMQKFSKSLADPEKLRKLSELGVDLTKFAGMKTEDAFVGFLETVSQCNSESQRLYILQQAFEEQGLRLAPLMRQGPEGVRDSIGRLMEEMPAVSNEAVAVCDTAAKAWSNTSNRIKTVWGEAVGQALIKAGESFGGIEQLMGEMETVVYGTAMNAGAIVSTIVGNFAAMWAGGLDDLAEGFDAFLASISPKIVRVRDAIAGVIAEGIAHVTGGAEAAANVHDAVVDHLAKTDYEHKTDKWAERYGKGMKKINEELDKARKKTEAYRKAREKWANTRPSTTPDVKMAPEDKKGLENDTKTAVRKGVREGLAGGLEAGSYDVLKSAVAFRASPAAVAAVSRAPAYAMAATPAAPAAASSAAIAAPLSSVNINRIISLLTDISRSMDNLRTV